MEVKTEYVSEKIVSKITGRGLATIRNDRYRNEGIPYVKFGKRVLYHLRDIYQFMEDHKVHTKRMGGK